MKKPYNWDEIETLLKKELKKSKHILTWATIGSLNVESDIDTIITKKSNSPLSNFYKEVHNIFDSLNEYLKKYDGRAIRFPQYKEDFKISSQYGPNDLMFHTMVYTSYSQIERDWGWYLLKDENLREILSSEKFLIGSFNDLISKEFQKPSYYDPILIMIYLYDRINSNYSKKQLIDTMNESYKMILRKLNQKPLKAKDEKDVKEIFYKMCDIIDKLNKEKSK